MAARAAIELFTEQSRTYVRFIRFVLYPQAIRAFFVESPLLRSGLRVLDAGCGTGVVSLALRDAVLSRGMQVGSLQGFDPTPTMLEHFRATLARRAIENVELAEADVLRLDALPGSWGGYDLVVSASMLEYVARERLVDALGGLRKLVKSDGALILFITRRNLFTRPFIGWWWQGNLYRASEIAEAFRGAGFSSAVFRKFPARYRQLAMWGYIVEARP